MRQRVVSVMVVVPDELGNQVEAGLKVALAIGGIPDHQTMITSRVRSPELEAISVPERLNVQLTGLGLDDPGKLCRQSESDLLDKQILPHELRILIYRLAVAGHYLLSSASIPAAELIERLQISMELYAQLCHRGIRSITQLTRMDLVGLEKSFPKAAATLNKALRECGFALAPLGAGRILADLRLAAALSLTLTKLDFSFGYHIRTLTLASLTEAIMRLDTDAETQEHLLRSLQHILKSYGYELPE